ncbi:glycosyltransferase family 2 protein [Marinobacter zhanjiangensis]|uniref:glycosyltransferase family 2 protein n=1 Tax=Marinobacter zhanjiangensis TaxID=578215 RepID=UPI001673F890|nr:glycosyltransferase family A protein [Marinobacter zhanjiangensis]
MKRKISIVICTRNRGQKITKTLASLENCNYKGFWEIILVNNGSTDETEKLVNDYIRNTKLKITLVNEDKPGLSRARNRGIAYSKGEILAFTDDDCYPSNDFLDKIDSVFEDSTIDYSGGKVLLHDPADLPITIQTRDTTLDIPPDTYIRPGTVLGANMSFRREVIIEHHGFDERLGAGTDFPSGEDTDLLRRLSRAGHKGWYDPSVIVYHHHERKSQSDYRKLTNNYSIGRGACSLKHCFPRRDRIRYMKNWYWSLKAVSSTQATQEIKSAFRFLVCYRFNIWQHPSISLRLHSDTE